MKHSMISIMLLLTFLTLSGCNINENTPNSDFTISPQVSQQPSPSAVINESPLPQDTIETSASSDLSLKDYYPIQDNTRYYYQGDGNEYASYDVFSDYTIQNVVQERVSNGGTISARIVQIEDGAITQIFSQGETYYRENMLKKANNNQEVLLKEPLVVGTTWPLSNESTRTITNLSVDITTPLGSYQTLEVTTKNGKDTTLDYYAKDVGLVKTIFQSDDSEITSTLNKIEKNTAYPQEITFYYPDTTGKKLISVTKSITFHTNDNTKQILAAAYKIGQQSTESVFTQDTQINSLYLNSDGAVYLDLSGDFLSIKKGNINEKILLQAIANTFGQYYGTKKVLLTVDTKPYQTDTLRMKKGEFLTVQYPDAQ